MTNNYPISRKSPAMKLCPHCLEWQKARALYLHIIHNHPEIQGSLLKDKPKKPLLTRLPTEKPANPNIEILPSIKLLEVTKNSENFPTVKECIENLKRQSWEILEEYKIAFCFGKGDLMNELSLVYFGRVKSIQCYSGKYTLTASILKTSFREEWYGWHISIREAYQGT